VLFKDSLGRIEGTGGMTHLGVGQFKLQVLDWKLGSENEPFKIKFQNLGRL
jgi:hypothetical protein